MKEMTLTRILSEIKLTEQKMNDVPGFVLMDRKTNSGKVTERLQLSKEDAEKKIQSLFDQWQSWQKNIYALRSALVTANAAHNVVISGKTYTLAQAIDRRKNIDKERNTVTAHLEICRKVKVAVLQHQEHLMATFNANILAKLSSDSGTKLNEADVEVLRKALVEHQEKILIDPIGIEKKLESMIEDIDAFKRDVDIALTEANSITKVGVNIV